MEHYKKSLGAVDSIDAVFRAIIKGTKWIMVTMHKGPYNTSNYATVPAGKRKVLAPVLQNLGIELVLKDHKHIYSRSKPINAEGIVVAETLRKVTIQGQDVVNPVVVAPKVYCKYKSINAAS